MFLVKHIDLHKEQNEQDTVKNTNTEEKPVLSLRVRYLPGDMLSNRELKMLYHILQYIFL